MSELTDLVLTTALDAVNIMLGTIGEQPVSTLVVSGVADVGIAKTILAETSRKVQSKGWDFNTDIDYALALDSDSKVPIPPNALRIDTTIGGFGSDLVQRAGFFWDRDNNTFILAQAVRANIVRYFAYEDLPESARYYIAIKAARKFQRRVLGDVEVEGFTQDEEFEAKADMQDADSETADRNMLKDPTLTSYLRATHTSQLPMR